MGGQEQEVVGVFVRFHCARFTFYLCLCPKGKGKGTKAREQARGVTKRESYNGNGIRVRYFFQIT
jgi:hypothetical protein